MNNQTKFLPQAIISWLQKAIFWHNSPFITHTPFAFEAIMINEHGIIINRKTHQANQEIIHVNGIKIEMVSIPGGTFLMGSPETEKNRRFWRESPQHPVTVTPFYIGKYPVTQRQWRAIMGHNPSYFKGKNRPVEQVLWNEAVAFCDKLSELTGKDFCLPSEAQWEYACRAGTTTPFHFGETLTTDLANYRGTDTQWGGSGSYRSEPKGVYRQQTTPVGSFLPNAFGLYDMHGNVWEWCADPWHKKYKDAPSEGRVWKVGGNHNIHVLRGGAWDLVPRSVRSASRDQLAHNYRRKTVGFRLASCKGT